MLGQSAADSASRGRRCESGYVALMQMVKLAYAN
jgi:hypothetical protein